MFGDTLYDGFRAGNVTTLAGCSALGIEHQRECFVGRGVLVDAARPQGVEVCPVGQVITPEMMDAALEGEGVQLHAGDILLVRTGYLTRWWTRPVEQSPKAYFVDSPGISRDAIPSLHEYGVSALATDTVAVEVMRPEDRNECSLPLHVGCLVDLGLTLGELWVLDELAADGTYEFPLAAQPLHLPGGMGSPLNPIALK